ncbi:MAG: clostripain-related cysteine peptidase [candidate division WOR-3 bacterium]
MGSDLLKAVKTAGGWFFIPLLLMVHFAAGAQWTVGVYMCADNGMSEQAYDDLSEMMAVGSTSEVNIVVQIDNAERDTNPDCRRYYIKKERRELLANLGEVDMADTAVLSDFIRFLGDRFPADNYFLIIWDHGNGWRAGYGPQRAVLIDESHGHMMGVAGGELRRALAQGTKRLGKRLTILGFDACLMSSIEVAFEVFPYCDYLLASEALIPWDGFPYERFLSRLTARPTALPAEFLPEMCADYVAAHPFDDVCLSAVDMRQLREYERQVSMRADELGARFGPERVSAFIENCKAFEFYNAKWRTSEPQLLASPSRIFLYLFDVETAKATTRTLATLLEYKGIISPAEAASTRQNLQFSNGLLAVGALRTKLLMRLLVYLLLSLPGRIWNAMKFLFKTLWCSAVVVKRFLRFVVKVYTDSEYRKQCALEKINSWLADFEHSDRWISSDDARVIRHEAENSSILDILQLAPLWAVVKIFKPPFIGTCANLAIIYMLFHTLNPGWLIPLFADGVIRFAIAVAVTRFRYKLLLLLSLLPTLGFAIPIPTQIMKDTPHLAEFLVRDVFGAKMGMMFPGIDRNSFRVYFYIRMMNIPVVIMRLLVRACELLPVVGRWSAQRKSDKI